MQKQTIYKCFLVILLMAGGNLAHSQSMLQTDPHPALQEEAQEIADMWTRELAMTTKQAELMEDKIIEFAIKRNKLIQSKMREEEKTKKLLNLQNLKYQDMRDILTKPQYERYIYLINKRSEEVEKEH